jgi:hypothetical protein
MRIGASVSPFVTMSNVKLSCPERESMPMTIVAGRHLLLSMASSHEPDNYSTPAMKLGLPYFLSNLLSSILCFFEHRSGLFVLVSSCFMIPKLLPQQSRVIF